MQKKEKKKIHEVIPYFLRKIKKSSFSLQTLEKKERHLTVFQGWLKKEGLANMLIEKIDNSILLNFKKDLKKKKLKKRTVDEYLKTLYDLLEYVEDKKPESDIQKIVNHYFKTKGYTLEEIKKDAKKRKIIYSRHTRPAKELLELAGSLEKAKKALDKIATWAKSRNLDYAIETVFKKWPEINSLKPKEKKKKPYYRNDPMVWSKSKNKWFVINREGDWLEFAGKEEEIEWKEE